MVTPNVREQLMDETSHQGARVAVMLRCSTVVLQDFGDGALIDALQVQLPLTQFQETPRVQLAWLCIVTVSVVIYPALLQKPPKRRMINGNAQSRMAGCCEDISELKLQVANLSRMLQELSKKQEGDWVNVVMQRNYRISGVYKLPPDEFLGIPDLEVFCDMETDGGGWTVIQRRKVGLTSFNRDWKQYREGFGNIRGDFWLGNENIYRLSRRPTVLRVELEDWEGNSRYAQYRQFTLSNEINSYRLFVGNYSGNTGRDSLRYHNNTAFSTKDKDNDKCVDDCAQFRKGGYWYNCCTDSNLNGVYYRKGEHTKSMDGITWYGWHGSTYSLKRSSELCHNRHCNPSPVYHECNSTNT
ncbi:hypothetical protein IHE44_0007874 [Lamprotornis superbus]|uniref:Angiopoietin-related protein 7 n=1 Tax=Lamprotornis superbus TaxID=245042 RepID=A0A835NQ94_9PASS|nr:hypothetical protein IHE44_0007874 [Lamprotornis superbus]